MPTAEQREREFWSPRDLAHRACEQHERQRADGLVALVARFNEMAREGD